MASNFPPHRPAYPAIIRPLDPSIPSHPSDTIGREVKKEGKQNRNNFFSSIDFLTYKKNHRL